MDLKQDLIKVNFTPKGMKQIRGIVIHSMGGFFKGTQSWFKNPESKSSANYIISKEGEVLQMVDESKLDMAFHAGLFDEGKCPDWALPNPNLYCLGIELEDEKKGSNWKYPEPEKQALRELVELLMKRYSIPRDHILLHRDLNPSRRNDPVGDFSFDWLFPVTAPAPEPVSDDVRRTLEALEIFRVGHNHGNLEGAVNALIGRFNESVEDRKTIEALKTDLRERDGFVKGQKITIQALQDQINAIADMLKVERDFTIIKGDLTRLLLLEDEKFVSDEKFMTTIKELDLEKRKVEARDTTVIQLREDINKLKEQLLAYSNRQEKPVSTMPEYTSDEKSVSLVQKLLNFIFGK